MSLVLRFDDSSTSRRRDHQVQLSIDVNVSHETDVFCVLLNTYY